MKPIDHDKFLRDVRIVVTVGAGGVGKTTSSIALALIGAAQGRRVGLLSIDPAKRLAEAMGLDFSSTLKSVALPKDYTGGGSLKAVMLDQKTVFDEMVVRFTKNERMAHRIFSNQMYQTVSRNLGGPLEYMALAKLEQMATSGEFDLIVLDTPPDTHAIDFLVRPNILSGFMENKVMTWLIKPFHLARRLGVQKLFEAGEKLMGGIAAVTGIKALNTLAEFLVLMEDVIQGFHRSGQKIDQLLHDASTGFVLVTTPTRAAIMSSRHLVRQLDSKGFALSVLLINQTLPLAVKKALAEWQSSEDAHAPGPREAILRIAEREALAHELVQRLRSDITQTVAGEPQIVGVPEHEGMLHTVEAISAMIKTWTVGDP